MAGTTKRVVLYARLSVSTEESVSIERQLVSGRKYAEARGWEVVAEIADDGVSASRVAPDARRGWKALLALSHSFDAVIVWKLDRLCRKVGDFVSAHESLRERGAGLVCVEQPIDMTTPEGRAFAQMLAVFAELEAGAISARVTAARHALLKSGRRAGGRPPYGWMNIPNPDGPGVVLAQDPERVVAVSELAALALQGMSLHALSRWMDEHAPARAPWKGRASAGWTPAAVEYVLKNPTMAGMVPFDPGRGPGDDPKPWAVLRDEDGVPIIDESTAILGLDERRKLLSALELRKIPGSRAGAGSSPSLLAGIVHCGGCSRPLHRGTAAGGSVEVFRCATRDCEAPSHVSRHLLEGEVVRRLLDERGDLQLIEAVETTPTTDLTGIGAAMDEIRGRLGQKGEDDEALFGQLMSLKQRRDAAVGETPRRRWRILSQSVAMAWSAAASDIPAQRKVLAGQLEALTVARGRRGGRGIDRSRVAISWRQDPYDAEEDLAESWERWETDWPATSA